MARTKSRRKDNIAPQLVETNVHTAGYHDKLQQDELPLGAATKGSYNFILDLDGKWTTRPGSLYLGTQSADTGGCTSSAKILRRDGVEIPIVFYGTKSKILHPDTLDWRLLETGYTSGLIFGKAMGEKTTDNVNKIIFANGTDNYRYWDGLTGVVSSFTINTIVLTGATDLADRGFTATGSLSNNGVPFAYTGISGSTFTGVTPDPTISGMAIGDAISSLPVNDGALPKGSVLASYNGRVVMFSRPSSAIFGGGILWGSVLNDYSSFLFSTPRVPSEGYQLMMTEGGGNGVALVQFEGGIAAFKQNAVSWHSVTPDQNDYPSIAPLLPYDETLSGHNGCVGQKAAFALRNQVFFVSPRKVINSLQRVSQVDYPQSLPFSDRIQTTCDGMTWDNDSCAAGFDYLGLFSGKANSTDAVPNKILAYDQRFDCWWTPIIGIEASSIFVYNGKLFATLGSSPDVVQLFTGTTDYATTTTNGVPINAKLVMGRDNYGKKSMQKKCRYEYIEGWMSMAGSVTFTLSFNETGVTYSGTLTGTSSGYFFTPDPGGEFGTEEFGAETFGGSWQSNNILPPGVGHFRILFNFEPTSFWNLRLTIETSSYFKLLSSAPDSHFSNVGIAPSLKSALA